VPYKFFAHLHFVIKFQTKNNERVKRDNKKRETPNKQNKIKRTETKQQNKTNINMNKTKTIKKTKQTIFNLVIVEFATMASASMSADFAPNRLKEISRSTIDVFVFIMFEICAPVLCEKPLFAICNLFYNKGKKAYR
jgi:hypothetical protein